MPCWRSVAISRMSSGALSMRRLTSSGSSRGRHCSHHWQREHSLLTMGRDQQFRVVVGTSGLQLRDGGDLDPETRARGRSAPGGCVVASPRGCSREGSHLRLAAGRPKPAPASRRDHRSRSRRPALVQVRTRRPRACGSSGQAEENQRSCSRSAAHSLRRSALRWELAGRAPSSGALRGSAASSSAAERAR